jgi:hypothetical protein
MANVRLIVLLLQVSMRNRAVARVWVRRLFAAAVAFPCSTTAPQRRHSSQRLAGNLLSAPPVGKWPIDSDIGYTPIGGIVKGGDHRVQIHNEVLLVVLTPEKRNGSETRFRFRSRFDLNQFVRATTGLRDSDAADIARRFVSTGRACLDHLV